MYDIISQITLGQSMRIYLKNIIIIIIIKEIYIAQVRQSQCTKKWYRKCAVCMPYSWHYI